MKEEQIEMTALGLFVVGVHLPTKPEGLDCFPWRLKCKNLFNNA